MARAVLKEAYGINNAGQVVGYRDAGSVTYATEFEPRQSHRLGRAAEAGLLGIHGIPSRKRAYIEKQRFCGM